MYSEGSRENQEGRKEAFPGICACESPAPRGTRFILIYIDCALHSSERGDVAYLRIVPPAYSVVYTCRSALAMAAPASPGGRDTRRGKNVIRRVYCVGP